MIINTAQGGDGYQSPDVFGDGRDGDFIVTRTTSLPVAVPHQSIVEKQYKSLIINPGETLKCDSWNAGLILRVKGDCTIHGTIDQSGKAPKTNSNNNYPYPAQLVCGNGGRGGHGARGDGSGGSASYGSGASGGSEMLKRMYGGGYGGGGGGGGNTALYYSGKYYDGGPGGPGGSSTGSTIAIPDIFVGGSQETSGLYGGGGGGGSGYSQGGHGGSDGGGNGFAGIPSSDSGDRGASGGGGGAGNYGGGVVLLYVGGNLLIDGFIECDGLTGGRGGDSAYKYWWSGAGGGGGGGGGGAIYICHRKTFTNIGNFKVNGGLGGSPGTQSTSSRDETSGSAGGVGSITVVQWTKDMGV
ncbi:MAG: hypothetical protein ACQGTM_08215 [bacterium]